VKTKSFQLPVISRHSRLAFSRPDFARIPVVRKLLFALCGAASLAAQGPRWALSPASKAAGYTLEITYNDNLATLSPPIDNNAAEGTIEATENATAYRGHVILVRASLRVEAPRHGARARLWMRIERPAPEMGFLDDFGAAAVTSDQWTTADFKRVIPLDAETIVFSVRSEGGARVQMRDFSIVQDTGLAPRQSMSAPNQTRGPLPARPRSALPAPADGPNLAAPDKAEQSRIINAAARIALSYIRSLPNFLCTEVTTRAQNQNLKGWRQLDVLAIRVSYEGGGERYRLLSVNGKPSQVPLRLLTGAQTEGEFGSVQYMLFQPHTATFQWQRYGTLRGRNVSVFTYQVPLEKSGLHLTFGSSRVDGADTISAYHGFVFIDHESNQIIRIDQIADPPPGFPILESRNVLDYDNSSIAGQQYLLPVMSESFIDSAGLSSHNVVEFRDYQKFSAQATVAFE
jgi:hypothetical protein